MFSFITYLLTEYQSKPRLLIALINFVILAISFMKDANAYLVTLKDENIQHKTIKGIHLV